MSTTPPPDPKAEDPDDLDQVVPETRDQVVSFRVPRDQYERSKRRARKQGRSLAGVLRSWFKLFASGEAPMPPELPDEMERAPKRKKKKSS